MIKAYLITTIFFYSICGLAQNLIPNPSFEIKKPNEKFVFHNAENTLKNWEYLKFHPTSLFHPSDAVYVDTLLFKEFTKKGFSLNEEVRKTVIKPESGNCYIRSNSFHKSLFQTKLNSSLIQSEPYIIIFKYHLKSLSNELNKLKTSHFGVSFMNKNVPVKELRNPKYMNKIDPHFKNNIVLNYQNPKLNETWHFFSSVFIPCQKFSYINIGTHTDFQTSINPTKEGSKVGKRGKYQDSFLFYVDNVELYKLSSFLKLNLKKYKNLSFALPNMIIDNSFNEKVISNNKYFHLLKSKISKGLLVEINIIEVEKITPENVQKINDFFSLINVESNQIHFVLKENQQHKSSKTLDSNSNIYIVIQ